jgi:antitoxin (DNA-binding transcriptional repressor) of toxin-antitoxin stability system
MEFGAFEAKNRLSERLTPVEPGADAVITRRRKAVGRLILIQDRRHDTDAREAADEITIARSKGVRLNATTTSTSTRNLVADGRP